MLTRPRDVFDSTERPTGLDELARALGAQVVDYAMKAKCCGGALALSHSEVTARLTGNVLLSAKDAAADIVMLACPMCHTALDAYQTKAEQAVSQSLDLPVLYFTQVMGLAFGLDPAHLGFDRHIVSPRSQLVRLGF
jgi:heterodisulfide reductase subunit B